MPRVEGGGRVVVCRQGRGRSGQRAVRFQGGGKRAAGGRVLRASGGGQGRVAVVK